MAGQQTSASNSSPGPKLPNRRVLAAAAIAVVIVIVIVTVLLTRDRVPGPVGSLPSATTPSSQLGGSGSRAPSTSTSAIPSKPPSGQSKSPGASSASPTSGGPTPPASQGAPRPTQPPVSLTAKATPVGGLTGRLARIEKVQGISNLPGEIAGPSLRITVEYDNATSSAVDLSGAVVNVYSGKALTPALMLSQPGAKPFPNSVAPGQKAQGVFVFNVPIDQRSSVRVEVDLSNQGSVLLFQGPMN